MAWKCSYSTYLIHPILFVLGPMGGFENRRFVSAVKRASCGGCFLVGGGATLAACLCLLLVR